MSEHEMILDQAMTAFVAAQNAGTLSSISAFIQNYPAEIHVEILEFIEEYLEMQAELAIMDIDPNVLEAVDNARQRVLDELSIPRISLRELRKQAGFLPGKLAELINLPTSVFGHLEGGRILLSSFTRRQFKLLIERLAAALDRTHDEITVALRVPVPTSAAIRLSAQDDTILAEEPFDFIEALEQSPNLTASMRAEWVEPSTT